MTGVMECRCVIEIQQRLPRARVVYCSATGVSELSNLAYCERLGLWGQGLSFPSFDRFYHSASKRGVFFLEMLAMELKRSGSYVSRGLSFKQAEFDTLHCNLTAVMIEEYNAAAAFWVKIRYELQKAIAVTGASNRLFSSYWSAHQRFFRQLILAYKVDFVVDHAQRCLETGHAVVIGLQTTGEAAQTRGIERRGGSTGSFISTCRETVVSFIQLNWPTKVVAETKGDDESESPISMPFCGKTNVSVSAHNETDAAMPKKSTAPVGTILAECEKSRDLLLAEAELLELPISALDSLIDKLGGFTKVAEMTGRKGRVVRGATGSISFQQRGMQEDEVDQVNILECGRFMNGTKLIAIISDAASTGISLHASNECANRRRRVHVTMELPWSADKAVQQLGRTHRSNQASGPIYNLVVTDLGGERRFAAAVSKRLQSLGALTKGDRRAAAGQNMLEFDLDNQYGRTSVRRILETIDGGVSIATGGSLQDLKRLCGNVSLGDALDARTQGGLGIDLSSEKIRWICAVNGHFQKALELIGYGPQRKESDAGNVTKFLGRLLGLRVSTQNALFQYFFSVMEYTIASAIKEGRYTDAITDLFGPECIVERVGIENIFQDNVTGATSAVHTLRVDRGLSWESAVLKLQSFIREKPSESSLQPKSLESEGQADISLLQNCDSEAADGDLQDSRKYVESVKVEIDPSEVGTQRAKTILAVESSERREDESPPSLDPEDLELESLSSGFYESRHVVPGRGYTGWLLALKSTARPNSYLVGRPNTGMMRIEMEGEELRSKYILRKPEVAEAGWRRLYEESVSYDVGRRVLTVHLLTGSLVPLWEQIELVVTSANSRDSSISKRDLEMKVVCAE